MDSEQIETIEMVKGYLPKISTAISKVVNSVYEDKMNTTINLMADIINGLQWLHQAASLTLQNNGYSLDNQIFNNILNEICKAYEDEDSIIVIDMLKYEVMPILDKIQNSVNHVTILN